MRWLKLPTRQRIKVGSRAKPLTAKIRRTRCLPIPPPKIAVYDTQERSIGDSGLVLCNLVLLLASEVGGRAPAV